MRHNKSRRYNRCTPGIWQTLSESKQSPNFSWDLLWVGGKVVMSVIYEILAMVSLFKRGI